MKKMLFAMIILIQIICSCSKNEESFILNKTHLQMSADDTETLTASETVNTWASDNVFTASVNNGIVTANHVGKASISATSAKGTAICDVEVLPVYQTYAEPVLDFGISKTSLKTKEHRTISKETTNALFYTGEKSTVAVVLYNFKDDKLNGVIVTVSLSASLDAAKYLKERYQPVLSDNDTFYFINNTKEKTTMEVVMKLTTQYAIITYLPFTFTSNSNLSSSLREKYMEQNRYNFKNQLSLLQK